ncbi:hypothetical protein KZ498_21640 [Haloarcula sp. 1CSR25-25]|nr:hypothetical protein [Haloarcula sp. 1CSR25-25]
MESAPRERSSNGLCGALAHVKRWRLIRGLLGHDQYHYDLVGTDAEESGDEEPERPLEMKDGHFPKQVRDGFIDWNRVGNPVSKGPSVEAIRPLLEMLVANEDEQ